jgi:hypothetical protein
MVSNCSNWCNYFFRAFRKRAAVLDSERSEVGILRRVLSPALAYALSSIHTQIH